MTLMFSIRLLGGFKEFFYVQPQFGEDSQFDYQFSNGLKPPPWILTYIHIPMVSVYCLEGQRCECLSNKGVACLNCWHMKGRHLGKMPRVQDARV